MQFSEKHQAVIYPLADPSNVLALIPEARRLPNGHTMVPFTLRNMQILRHLGQEAMSPIETQYDFPSRFPKPRWNQLITSAFKTLYPNNIDTSDMRCVDAETEYLSPTGWVRMDSYAGGKVAQYHPATGRAEFVEPNGYHVSPCAEMIRFKASKGVDQKLSPGHRVLYVTERGKLAVESAEQVMQTQLKNAQGFRGRFITTFGAPAMPGIDLTDAQLRVQVAIVTARMSPDAARHVTTLQLRAAKKERLRAMLTSAGIAFSENKGFCRFDAPRADKEFTKYYWACNEGQLRIIVEEMQYWGGYKHKAGSFRFCRADKGTLDFIQYAFACTGRTGDVTQTSKARQYPGFMLVVRSAAALVAMKGNSYGGKTKPASIEPTIDGNMYCFEVPSTFLILRRNSCIFATGNTGKTLSTLWAADFLMQLGARKRALIIAPLSTLERVWENEIKQSFHNRRTCAILHGSVERRLKRLAEPHDFYVINPDGIKVGTKRNARRQLVIGELIQQLIKRLDIDLLIIDELSIYKHANSINYKVLEHYVEMRGAALWRWGLTGTPTGTSPTDAWAQGKLIHGRNKRMESFESFRNRTMFKINEFKYKPRPEATQIAADWLKPSVRFTRLELGFPPLTFETRTVAMSAAQVAAYNQMRTDLEIITAAGEVIDAVNEAALRTKLLQIAGGAIYGEDHKPNYIDAAPRIQALRDIIDEAGAKIIVLCPLTSVIELIHSHIKKEITCEIVNGNVSPTRKNQIFRDFQDKTDPQLLICDPRSMSHGLNLTASQTIVWYLPVDSLETYEQANARIDGPGSCGVVINLASSPVEREIYKRHIEKKSIQGSVLAILRKG